MVDRTVGAWQRPFDNIQQPIAIPEKRWSFRRGSGKCAANADRTLIVQKQPPKLLRVLSEWFSRSRKDNVKGRRELRRMHRSYPPGSPMTAHLSRTNSESPREGSGRDADSMCGDKRVSFKDTVEVSSMISNSCVVAPDIFRSNRAWNLAVRFLSASQHIVAPESKNLLQHQYLPANPRYPIVMMCLQWGWVWNYVDRSSASKSSVMVLNVNKLVAASFGFVFLLQV